jgi:uncharacterized protein YkwD
LVKRELPALLACWAVDRRPQLEIPMRARRPSTGSPASCWLVLGLALTGAAGHALAADRSTALGYAEWAKAAVASPPPGARFLGELERQLSELANRRRAETAPGLEADPGLELAARAHALDMLERGYLDHVGPDGRDVADRVAILHRRFIGGTGENLAEHEGLEVEELAGQAGPLAVKIVDGWMASPGHRQNLLEPEYSHHGLAAAGQGDRVVIVQVFGRRRALLKEPLPLEVERGAKLRLEVETSGDASAPQKSAFAPPGKAADELVTLDLSSSEVVVGPGEYRLKFFIPTGREGYFEIADGPLLVVR